MLLYQLNSFAYHFRYAYHMSTPSYSSPQPQTICHSALLPFTLLQYP